MLACYPDLLNLVLILPTFPLVDTHSCMAYTDVTKGQFSEKCGGKEAMGEVVVEKIAMDSDVKMEEVEKIPEVLLSHPLQAQLGPCSGPAVPCTAWSRIWASLTDGSATAKGTRVYKIDQTRNMVVGEEHIDLDVKLVELEDK